MGEATGRWPAMGSEPQVWRDGGRHEFGAVTYPEGRRYAVAVLKNVLTLEPDHRGDGAICEVAGYTMLDLRRAATGHAGAGESTGWLSS